MGMIAMLLPREEQVRQARDLIREMPGCPVREVRCIGTQDCVEQARESIDNGAQVLIARGLQALLISHALNTPLVPVRITAQGLGMLLLRAKRLCTQSRPKIALVAAENTLCDTECCNILFGVELRVFSFVSVEEYSRANSQALAWEPEVMIGGDHTLEAARQAGVNALFLDLLDDSFLEAIRSAQTALLANEQNQRANAQMDALLSSTTNGYIQLDGQGIAIKSNDIMRELLGMTEEALLHRPLEALMPGMEKRVVESVLEGGGSYSTFLHINCKPVVAILSPIRFEDGRVEGAVLSCHKVRKSIQAASSADQAKNGLTVFSDRTFDSLHQRSACMARVVDRAKLFSQSGSPILLLGERGLERDLLAQCIHNNSLFHAGPFVSLSCGGLAPGVQREALFGTGEKREGEEIDLGAFGTANNGTLFLQEADRLDGEAQYHVYRALRYHRVTHHRPECAVHLNLRLIACSETDLYAAAREGRFRWDLYDLLSGLKLLLPPLRERPEDLSDLLQERFQQICEGLRRYHVLTSGAWELLRGFPWPGNLIQIDSFLERLVLCAQRRSIDEVLVRDLWAEFSPAPMGEDDRQPDAAGCFGTEALRIMELLETCRGNRAQTAQALGISTTTLWRRMKRLGIASRYDARG